jgi:hypothetical protein
MKKAVSIILAAAVLFALCAVSSAKTTVSARADNVFFYARNAQGKNVLIKVVPLGELDKISHGQPGTDKNYYVASTDNYPTPQYCEARGITVPELLDYVKSVTSVKNASSLDFRGADTLRLMATDSYGNYNRSWTYDELYGETRYYFEGLISSWNASWEIAGEDDSKTGLTMDEYNAKYRDGDANYAAKRAVFDAGVVSVPILATRSYSGRTTSDTLLASTETGIADYIRANGGVAAGSLKDVLEDTWSLRLALPMTQADLMAAHRTAFDNFKWTYNLLLEQFSAPDIKSLGTVAEPVAAVSVSGGKLTIAITCATAGASVYYSYDGAPQIPYTAPITLDVSGRDLSSDPVTFYMTAVKEGYDDAGIITAKYPGLAPSFKTLYSAMANSALTFAAADGVTASDWTAWTGALTSITLKTPTVNGYLRVDTSKYAIDNATKSVTFDGALFPDAGSYSFVFHAAKYADKSVSLTIKKPAPAFRVTGKLLGCDVAFISNDAEYQNGASLYVTPPGGAASMISATFLDRSAPGRVTLKAAYFASPGCVISAAGEYKFSLVNSKYEPGTADLAVSLAFGVSVPELSDVAVSDWYYSAVRYVMSAGLFDAQGDAFGAGAPMTRAMLVTALYRLEGSPDVTGASGAAFTDVPREADTFPAVTWAESAGVVNGMGDGTFAPDASITREQIAAMFYRYAKSPAPPSLALDFTDASAISDWAESAMLWAVDKKLINGMGDGRVAPRGTATRAQVAQILLNDSAR